MLAALGQRDVQRLGRLCCIREEQLIEIAHAVEQQIVRMRRFDGEILRHHGGGVAGHGRGIRLYRFHLAHASEP